MTGVFAEVVNMSGTACWLILAVIIVRFLCRKATKNLCYLLWALVGIRLLCPFSIESEWSLIPNEASIEKALAKADEDSVAMFEANQMMLEGTNGASNIYEGIKSGYESLNLENEQEVEASTTGISGLRPIEIMTLIWSIGAIGILGYTAISFWKLKKKVAVSIRKSDEVWVCDAIHSPFILGVIKPRIFIPSAIKEEQVSFILAHEKAHLKWHDNLWKVFGLFILAIHWFNPLVWLAYALLCRDIELACDERVVKKMSEEDKRNYVKSLLICSSPTRFEGLCSVSFGEISIRKRVKGVLNYKRASLWRFITAILICAIVVVGFMTNPKGQEFIAEVESEIKAEIENKWKRNTVLYETTADLNHDGYDDLVQIIKKVNSAEGYYNLEYPTNTFSVKIFLGEKDGTYRSKAVALEVSKRIVWDIWIGQKFNGLYAITEYEGKEYLLYAHVGEVDGEARYRYDVVGVNQYNQAYALQQSNVTFACDPFYSEWDVEPHREDVVPKFREKITPWVENARILLCSDEDGVYVANDKEVKSAGSYFETVWQRSDEAELAAYTSLKGSERWEKVLSQGSDNPYAYMTWIKQQAATDFSQWYVDYNGETVQRINHHEDGSMHCSLSICCDIIYYQSEEAESTQRILYKMIREMVDGKDDPLANCPYDIHAFDFPEQPVVQIAEDMWLLRYINGYYGYEGIDGVTIEERMETTDCHFRNGLVSLPRSEESSEYWYILIEKDGVYRLERLKDMMGG